MHWRRETEPDIAPAVAAAAPRRASQARSALTAQKPAHVPIPTERELELERELSELRGRLEVVDGRRGEGPT